MSNTFFVFATSTYGDMEFRGEYDTLQKAQARMKKVTGEGREAEIRNSYTGTAIQVSAPPQVEPAAEEPTILQAPSKVFAAYVEYKPVGYLLEYIRAETQEKAEELAVMEFLGRMWKAGYAPCRSELIIQVHPYVG